MTDLVLTLHVIGGATGLCVMAVPLIAKKGGGWHRRAGWLFVAGMSTSGVTGAVIAVRFLLETRTGPAVFFGLLSLLLLESLWVALAALRRKGRPEPSRRPLDLGAPATLALAGLGAAAFGVHRGSVLPMAFGALSLLAGLGDLRFALRPLPSRMAWWYQHMASIMVACITAVTAFMVLNVNRLVGPLPPMISWLPWILPTALTVPLFLRWIQRYKVRFREAV